MAACTSCSAASMFRSRVNWSVICELPKLDTLRHLRERRHLPELPLERRRHRRRHGVGAGAGEQRGDDDGRVVDLRQRRDGELRGSRAMPARRRPIISSVVATGRRMKGSEMFIAWPPTPPGLRGRSAWRCPERPPAPPSAARADAPEPCASGGRGPTTLAPGLSWLCPSTTTCSPDLEAARHDGHVALDRRRPRWAAPAALLSASTT